MMTRNSCLLLLSGLILSVTGCVGEEGAGGATERLALCPDGTRADLPCDPDSELYCDYADTGLVCRCERFADDTTGGAGVIVCEPPETDPPVGRCIEHVRTGDACDPAEADACTHTCDGDVRCRCVPESDRAGCSHVWLCDGGVEPPPGGGDPCADDSGRLCGVGGVTECITEDGRRCFCDASASGEVGFRCEEPPPGGGPPPCAADDLGRCEHGEEVYCALDGRICRCGPTADGSIHFDCDPTVPPPPTDPPECTPEMSRLCGDSAAGIDADLVCRLGDRLCRCDPSSPEGFRCEEPPPPPPPPPSGLPECTDDMVRFCSDPAAGSDGRTDIACTLGDRICRCDASTPTGFRCE